MKIQLSPDHDNMFEHATVTIDMPRDDLTVDAVFENLIIPALIAWGYSEANINEWLEQSPVDKGGEK